MYLFHKIQSKLDQIAMYRTVTIGLFILTGISLGFGAFGIVPYTFSEQIISLAVALVVALVLNIILAKLWRVTANHESAIITGLILFFLVVPGFGLADQWVIAAITAVAIASKFLLTYKRQHIFNAAAFGAMVFSLTGVAASSWWIGSPEMFIPLVVIGSLVVMKIRRWTPVLWFLAVAFIVYLIEAWRLGFGVVDSIPVFFLSWPALFLAFFMLTEPFTMPPTKKLQAMYGALVGGLSSAAFFAPYIVMSPELALVIGNMVFWPSTLRQKLYLTLLKTNEIAKDTWEFVFKKPTSMTYLSGQYLEWMLPHSPSDTRGLRRYFTIASAPEETDLRLAVRFVGEKGSTYKKALSEITPGQIVIASQCSGDFLLPKDTTAKLGFIAGGIGITPFRSHLEHMRLSDRTHDTILFYCNNTASEIAYQEYFDQYPKESFEVVHALGKEEKEGYEHGYLNQEIIERRAPDYLEREWYLSGPPGMVNAYAKLLVDIGVERNQITKDFFPGLA